MSVSGASRSIARQNVWRQRRDEIDVVERLDAVAAAGRSASDVDYSGEPEAAHQSQVDSRGPRASHASASSQRRFRDPRGRAFRQHERVVAIDEPPREPAVSASKRWTSSDVFGVSHSRSTRLAIRRSPMRIADHELGTDAGSRTSSAIRNSPSRTPLVARYLAPVPEASSTSGDPARRRCATRSGYPDRVAL